MLLHFLYWYFFCIKLPPNQNFEAREGGDGYTPEVYQKKSGRKGGRNLFSPSFPSPPPMPKRAEVKAKLVTHPPLPSLPFAHTKAISSFAWSGQRKKWGEEEGFAEPDWNASAYLKKEASTLIISFKSNLVGYWMEMSEDGKRSAFFLLGKRGGDSIECRRCCCFKELFPSDLLGKKVYSTLQRKSVVHKGVLSWLLPCVLSPSFRQKGEERNSEGWPRPVHTWEFEYLAGKKSLL